MAELTRPPIDRGSMRASDADRQLVEEVLNTAYVDGRLTKEELDERLGQVLAARTFDDLAPVTADLVLGAVTAQYATPYALARTDAAGPVVDVANASTDVDTITVILGETKRTTPWRMHQHTSVTAVLGEVLLDLREAALEGTDLSLNITTFMGEVKILVPAGVRVRSKLNPFLGDMTIKGVPEDPNAAVTLTLTGNVILGEVNVRGPEHLSFKDKLLKRK